MKKVYLILTYIIFSLTNAYSSTFTITEVDTNNYPKMSVGFSAYDFENKFIHNISPSDFVVRENGEIVPEELVEVLCQGDDAPLNIVLVIDQSTSMDSMYNGKTKLRWVMDAAEGFIDYVQDRDSVFTAITSFAGRSRVISNFSNDIEELKDSLNKIDIVSSVTNFNVAFNQEFSGAIELLKERPAYQRRAILFLSDGFHKAGSEQFMFKDIEEDLQTNNIQMFAVTFLNEVDQIMASLCDATGGKYYNLFAADKLQELFYEIAGLALENSICQLIWQSKPRCYSDDPMIEVQIDLLLDRLHTLYTSYIAPYQSMTYFYSDKSYYFLGNPPTNQYLEDKIILKSEINPTIIKDYTIDPNQHFTIESWGQYGKNIPPNGILLEPGEEFELIVRFTQGNIRSKRSSKLTIYGEPCNIEIDLSAGVQLVEFTEPIESNIYSACKEINVEWTGLEEGTPVDLSYEKENSGDLIQLVKNYTPNNYKFTPDNESSEYKFYVIESIREGIKWFNDYGSSGDDKILSITLSPDELYFYICGYFSNMLDIQGSTLNSYGGTDAFVAKFDIYGNLEWMRKVGSLKNDKAVSVTVDKDRNVFILGEAYNNVRINDVPYVLPQENMPYIFVVEYDDNGVFQERFIYGADDQNIQFRPYPEDIGMFSDDEFKKVKINMQFEGSYYDFNINDGISNPYEYPIDLTMHLDHNLNLVYFQENERTPGVYADTVVNDYIGNKYFVGYFNVADTTISGSIFSTRGGTDFYIQKKGEFPRSADTTGNIRVNKPELKFEQEVIYFEESVLGHEKIYNAQAILTNTGLIDIEIVDYYIEGNNRSEFGLRTNIIGTVLKPNETINIDFWFTPNVYGDRSAIIRLISDCGEDVMISLTGEGTCGLVAEELIDMGEVVVNTEKKAVFKQIVYNPTKSAIAFEPILRGIYSTDFDINPKGQLLILAESYYEFEITFNPLNLGEREAYINFNPIEDCKPARTDLVGLGIRGELKIDSVDIGLLRIRSQKDSILFVQNLGFTDEIINNITLIENTDNAFQLNYSQGFPINVDEGINIEIPFTFSPNDEKDYRALVEFDIAGQAEPKYALITGSGGIPKINIVPSCGKPVYYGDKAEVNLIVYNPSNSMVLSVKEIQILNNDIEYSWQVAQPTDRQVELGNNYQFFKIDYVPVEGEDQLLEINVVADNYDGTFQNEWKDNYAELECPVPDFIYTNPLDFDNNLICNTDSLDLVITNDISSYSMIVYANSLSITGEDASAFSAELTENIQLQIGESDTITVYFNPKKTGLHKAKLYLETSHPVKNIEVDLLGTGQIIVPIGEPKTITTYPGENGVYKLNVEIPDLKIGKIDAIDIDIQYDYRMILMNIDDISTPFENSDLISWQAIENNHNNGFNFKLEGELATPYTGLLFEIPYIEFLTDVDSTTISATVNYTCASDKYDLTLVHFGDICFEDGRMVIISPEVFNLQKPSPNPINNGVIKLSFNVGLQVFTELNVYNSQGKLIDSYINSVLEPGEYEINIDATHFSNGMYFIKFKSGPYIKTEKIMIID